MAQTAAPQGLEAKYGLPATVRFCTRCVISNQRPNSAVEYQHTRQSRKDTIAFDAEGVCDACRFAERKRKTIDWTQRERELRELKVELARFADRYRGTPLADGAVRELRELKDEMLPADRGTPPGKA